MGARAQHAPEYRHMCGLLRGWRLAAGLTQRGLAEQLRVPYSYIWKVEAQERRIDPIEFIAWCKACNVSPAKAVTRIGR